MSLSQDTTITAVSFKINAGGSYTFEKDGYVLLNLGCFNFLSHLERAGNPYDIAPVYPRSKVYDSNGNVLWEPWDNTATFSGEPGNGWYGDAAADTKFGIIEAGGKITLDAAFAYMPSVSGAGCFVKGTVIYIE